LYELPEEYASVGIWCISCIVMCRITQPLFVGGLIRYFSPESSVSQNTAFMYASAIVICSAVNVIVRQSFMMAMFHLGMKIRVSLCSLLY